MRLLLLVAPVLFCPLLALFVFMPEYWYGFANNFKSGFSTPQLGVCIYSLFVDDGIDIGSGLIILFVG